MSSTTVMATNTQKELIGYLWTKTTINKACQLILNEMPMNDMTPGGQPEYRYDHSFFFS